MAKERKNVNLKVDIKIKLLNIPGLDNDCQSHWKIRALEINGRSLALAALKRWQARHQAEWKKIRKVMQIHGTQEEIKDEKKVKKSSNPDHGEVYEMRADKGHARLMFFYDSAEDSIIVCTNSHWKGKGSQDADFATCKRLKDIYFNNKGEKP